MLFLKFLIIIWMYKFAMYVKPGLTKALSQQIIKLLSKIITI